MPRLIDADAIPWCNYDLDNYHSFEGVDKDVVDEMPTIDPESLRPNGRWVKGKKEKLYCDWEMNGWFDYPEKCSCCGYDATEYGMGEGNYCPNCGAKMDLEEET